MKRTPDLVASYSGRHEKSEDKDSDSKSSDKMDKSSSSVSLVCEVFEAVELVPATEGFFKFTEEPWFATGIQIYRFKIPNRVNN